MAKVKLEIEASPEEAVKIAEKLGLSIGEIEVSREEAAIIKQKTETRTLLNE